jgi:hypothetical protein
LNAYRQAPPIATGRPGGRDVLPVQTILSGVSQLWVVEEGGRQAEALERRLPTCQNHETRYTMAALINMA